MAKIIINIKAKDIPRIKNMLSTTFSIGIVKNDIDLSTDALVISHYEAKIKQTLIQELKSFEREKTRREKESEIVIDEISFDE